MKKPIPAQLIVALAILVLGGGALGGEYFLVKWYPSHRQRVADETLKPVPFRDDSLGIEMQVATGIYGKVESFRGGLKIYRTKFWGVGPSLTIFSEPNPDGASEFSPQVLAKWQTEGTYKEIFRYDFEHTKVMDRDAVFIRQWKDRGMILSARIISPDRIIEAECSPGGENEALYLQACDSTLRTLKLPGPAPSAITPPTLELEKVKKR